ncbi:hypothetical protein BDZ91DRAFT_801995 [Kalaharituber pfeilii]|nr:hypothetical protein BDZ91DRAFT_801995 [Kalaharituber pfeilii]
MVDPSATDITTRHVKIHGYAPAESILEFNSSRNWKEDGDIRTSTEFWKKKRRRNKQLEYRRDRRAGKTGGRVSGNLGKLRVEELVVVRRFEVDKKKGMKLEVNRSRPMKVAKYWKSGVSAWVQPLHEETPPKRYHVNHMKAYKRRGRGTERRRRGYKIAEEL